MRLRKVAVERPVLLWRCPHRRPRSGSRSRRDAVARPVLRRKASKVKRRCERTMKPSLGAADGRTILCRVVALHGFPGLQENGHQCGYHEVPNDHLLKNIGSSRGEFAASGYRGKTEQDP